MPGRKEEQGVTVSMERLESCGREKAGLVDLEKENLEAVREVRDTRRLPIAMRKLDAATVTLCIHS